MTLPLANFTSPADWVIYASLVTSGFFWPLMLIAIFIISFGSLLRATTMERAFATSSFFTGILAAFLFIIGGMDSLFAIIFVALAIAGFILLLFSRD